MLVGVGRVHEVMLIMARLLLYQLLLHSEVDAHWWLPYVEQEPYITSQ